MESKPSDDMQESNLAPSLPVSSGESAKRPWRKPTLEEVDDSATRVTLSNNGSDGVLYS